MHRFFVPPESLGEQRVRIGGDVAQQIRRVLRMRPGDHFCLLDGLGYEYQVTLVEYVKEDVWAEVRDKARVQTEPAHSVSMYLSLLNKADKFEWALQKCTEVGAARFVPLVAERSVTDAVRGMRRERWERIIQEAAEQSGRGIIPTLGEPVSLKQALEVESLAIAGVSSMDKNHIGIMPELGGADTIANTLKACDSVQSVSLYIGPEGGFTPAEVDIARDKGVMIVRIGARTLRAETAAVAALTLTLHELGEMGA